MRRLGVLLARLQVWLRVLVVLAWVGGFAWLVHSLAPISGDGGAVAQIVPKHARAIEAERLSTEKFAFPLITRTVVVVRDPRGLSPSRQASLVGLAASLSAHTQARYEAIGGALLLLNTIGGTPFTREPGTTALLYLFFRPDAGAGTQQRVAADLLRHAIGHRRGEFEGVTGTAVGQHEQNQLIESRLPWVELASLVLVLLATGFYFRSLGASLLTLASVAGAYLVAERVVATAARAASVRPLRRTSR